MSWAALGTAAGVGVGAGDGSTGGAAGPTKGGWPAAEGKGSSASGLVNVGAGRKPRGGVMGATGGSVAAGLGVPGPTAGITGVGVSVMISPGKGGSGVSAGMSGEDWKVDRASTAPLDTARVRTTASMAEASNKTALCGRARKRLFPVEPQDINRGGNYSMDESKRKRAAPIPQAGRKVTTSPLQMTCSRPPASRTINAPSAVTRTASPSNAAERSSTRTRCPTVSSREAQAM